MNEIDIKQRVCRIVLALFKGEGVDLASIERYNLIAELGLDSIRFITLIVELENDFNIIITDDCLLMDNFQYIDDIVNIVKQRLFTEHLVGGQNEKNNL